MVKEKGDTCVGVSPGLFVGAISDRPLIVGILCEKTVSVLFGKIAAKRTKNGVGGVSLVATSDQGRCPWSP